MDTTAEPSGHSRIDMERFFHALAGKLEPRLMDTVAAAMAEAAVEKRGKDRVVNCSQADLSRLAQERCRLREMSLKAKRG